MASTSRNRAPVACLRSFALFSYALLSLQFSSATPAHRQSTDTASAGALTSVSRPTIGFASYFGRSAQDRITAMAVGSDGTIFVTGTSPAASANLHSDAFVAHLSADGSMLLYSAYFGGAGDSESQAIAVDPAGNAYIAGHTFAADFPVRNPLQPSCSRDIAGQCSGDAFLAKLNPDGSIAFSSFLGGSSDDSAKAIAIDSTGNIYLAGSTSSTNFPVFRALQSGLNGKTNAFAAKISPDGLHLIYSTYLGGSAEDQARATALDSVGSLYIAGQTFSQNFPTHNPLQNSCHLNSQSQCSGTAFISKLSPDGQSFLYSTYLGGSSGDAANAIAVDSSGNAYLAGETLSTNFPLLQPSQSTSRGNSEAFVSKISADGAALLFSSYFGGSGDDRALAITLDSSRNIFITGATDSSDLLTLNAVQSTCSHSAKGACSQDAFAAVFDSTGNTLRLTTYLGGSSTDESRAIAITPQAELILAGSTTSADFPAAKQIQLPSSLSSQHASSPALKSAASSGALVAKLTGIKSAFAGSKTTGPTPDGPPTCSPGDTQWIVGAGNWSTAANWSTGTVPNGAGINVCLIPPVGVPAATVTLDIAVNVGKLTLGVPDSLTIANNQQLIVNGNIGNAGLIQLVPTGNTTFLSFSGNISLSGGGTVSLVQNAGAAQPIVNQAAGSTTLTNVDNTIQGAGQLGNNGLAVVNQATIDANNPTSSLTLNPSSVVNTGTLEATAGGTLNVTTPITNSGGAVQSTAAGSSVLFNSGSLAGGTLTQSGGAFLGTPSSSTFNLDGASLGPITINGTYTGANNSETVVSGTVNNTGTLLIAATANTTFLSLAGNVSFTGGGTINLSTTGAQPIVNQSQGNSTLTNVNNLIQGSGQIGNNGLTFVNMAAGVVNANAAASLSLNATSVTNTGLLEATGTSTLLTSTGIVNAGGTISAAGSAIVAFSTGTTIQGGTLSAAATATLGTAASQSTTLDGTTSGPIKNVNTYTGQNNSQTFLLGTINNLGTILIAPTANTTFLTVSSGNVQLTGGGTVNLLTPVGGAQPIINESAGNSVLTNVNNVIQGSGQIGNNGLAFTNQVGGIVNATGPGPLQLNANAVRNQGLFEATAGQTLQISVTVNNAAATITSTGANSTVQFVNGATIQGGTVSTSNGGLLGTPVSQSATLDGATQGTINVTGTYTGANNSQTFLVGTINNTGTILIAATANTTFLTPRTGTVTLTGSGTVSLTTTAAQPIINQSAANTTLTNVNNTITGSGQIGNNGLAVINQGTIDANTSGVVLTINPSSFLNQGLMEATAGGILQFNGSTLNNKAGTVKVDGASSAVQFVNNVSIQGGTIATSNGGVLGTPASSTVTLDGNAQGALTIAGTYTAANNSQTFLVGTINNTGTIIIAATANTTFLTALNGNVMLTGGGTISLTTTAAQPIINQSAANTTLTNVNNIIMGSGQIGNNGLAVINQGTIDASTSGVVLTINPSSFLNQGLMEATSGGILQFSGSTLNNKAGTVKVDGAASSVQFVNNVSIQGGTVATANGGILGTPASSTVTLDGNTQGPLTLAGTYTAANNSQTFLVGTINNTGTIIVAATGNTTFLTALSGNVTLTGAGTVSLTSTGAQPIINQSAANTTLTNVNNTISGSGQIGNNGLIFVNQGTINANTAAVLTINPSSLTNSGLIAVAAADPLQITPTAIANANGTIRVDGNLAVANPVTITGGNLIGTGTITGNISSAGTTQGGDAPASGILTVNGNGLGNYAFTAAGALNTVIGGLTAGTQYSQLNLTGAAMLGGTLNITIANGFVPAVGDTFTILNAASLTGQFATTNLPTLSAGLHFAVNYTASSVVVSVAGAQTGANLSPNPLTFAGQRVNTASTAQTVTLTNSGTAAITLAAANSVQISGTDATDFAVAAGTTCTNGATVAPAASCLIQLTFKPAAAGARTATLTLTDTSSPTTQTTTLDGTGIAPIASLAPAALAFGNQPVGVTSAPKTVTITNTGTDTLNFPVAAPAFKITGTNAADFAILASGTTCAATLAPSAACNISVTFTPSTAANESATLTITDDSGAIVGTTQTVALSGGGSGPAATIAPTSITFPVTAVGVSSAPVSITVSNSGTAVLTFTSAPAITGAAASDFSFAQGTTCAANTNLQSGTSCTLAVVFTPAANGTRTASITLADNATPATQSIPLSGTTPVNVTLSTTTLAFASSAVGTPSAPQTVTLTNTGGSPLNFTSAPAITGANATDFAIATGSTCVLGTAVPAGATCVVNIIFTPSASGARGPALLTFTEAGASQSVSLTGSGADFTVTPPSGPVTVTDGGSITFNLTVTPGPGGFPSPVTFTATGLNGGALPAGLCVYFPQPNPQTIATTKTFSFLVTTTAPGAAGSIFAPPSSNHRPPPAFFLILISAILAALLFFISKSSPRTIHRCAVLVPALALLFAICSLSGCAAGGSFGATAASFTPRGTVQIAVTITSGSISHTTIVTLQIN